MVEDQTSNLKPLDVTAVRNANSRRELDEIKTRLEDRNRGPIQVHPSGKLSATGNQQVIDGKTGEVVYQTTELKKSRIG